jgi:hypothetical protein
MEEKEKTLSPQILDALSKANLTVQDAQKKTVEELVEIKGIGEASAKQILEAKVEDVETVNEKDVDNANDQLKEKKKVSSLDEAAMKLEDAKSAQEVFEIGDYEFEFNFIERGVVMEKHKICGSGNENDAMNDARLKADVYNNGRWTVSFTGNFKKIK